MARRCDIGAIAIGRNEGERLRRCLRSLSAAAKVIYVDSGSTDGSAEWARKQGIEVIDLDVSSPFTAARARNSGYRRMREIAPEISYVQFVDGDCELDQGWLTISQSFLDTHPDVAVVCGRLRERHPEESIYNWLCDREWDTPSGEVRVCGGIAVMRTSAFAATGGYRDDLIAGEEPELCVRLRAAGWRIWRLDCEMATHDAAMRHFSQWWRRTVRNGYAFAQGAYLHGKSRERHWLWEARRAWLWGVWLPLGCLAVALAFEPWGWIAFSVYPLQVLRQIVRNRGPLRQRALVALFQVLGRFPEGWGQIKFMRDRLLGLQAHLIEYK
jgi:GT2 family glycosyltransferase